MKIYNDTHYVEADHKKKSKIFNVIKKEFDRVNVINKDVFLYENLIQNDNSFKNEKSEQENRNLDENMISSSL